MIIYRLLYNIRNIDDTRASFNSLSIFDIFVVIADFRKLLFFVVYVYKNLLLPQNEYRTQQHLEIDIQRNTINKDKNNFDFLEKCVNCHIQSSCRNNTQTTYHIIYSALVLCF